MRNNSINMSSITVPENIKRRITKGNRNIGLGAIAKANSNPVTWNQMKDPLFKVKGKERHRKLKGGYFNIIS